MTIVYKSAAFFVVILFGIIAIACSNGSKSESDSSNKTTIPTGPNYVQVIQVTSTGSSRGGPDVVQSPTEIQNTVNASLAAVTSKGVALQQVGQIAQLPLSSAEREALANAGDIEKTITDIASTSSTTRDILANAKVNGTYILFWVNAPTPAQGGPGKACGAQDQSKRTFMIFAGEGVATTNRTRCFSYTTSGAATPFSQKTQEAGVAYVALEAKGRPDLAEQYKDEVERSPAPGQ